MSTSTTKIAGEDMTDHHVERYQAEQAAQSMSEPKRGTDAQILFERELTCSAINGAMAFGYQNTNPPPSDDHWLAPFWKVGRKQAEMESALLASKPAALPFGTLKALWKNGSDNRDLLEGSMAHAFALRIFAAQNAATPTTPAQSCGEDAANGAIGEREAFEAWWNANQTWPVAAKNLAFLVWNSRAALAAEKVAQSAEPVAWALVFANGTIDLTDAELPPTDRNLELAKEYGRKYVPLNAAQYTMLQEILK